MEAIADFNIWLTNHKYTLENNNFDEKFVESLIQDYKLKLEGRNILDKYMRYVFNAFKVMKENDEITDYENLINEYKKDEKNRVKMEKKQDKKDKKTKEKQEEMLEKNIIETIKKVAFKKSILIDVFENQKIGMILKLIGDPIQIDKKKELYNAEWYIKVGKNEYIIKIVSDKELDENTNYKIEILGKKIVKKDLKLIKDYMLVEREVIEKLKENEESTIKAHGEKEIEVVKSKRGRKKKAETEKEVEVVKSKRGRKKKEDTEKEVEETDNKNDLYKELFGESSIDDDISIEELDIYDIPSVDDDDSVLYDDDENIVEEINIKIEEIRF